jgi:hypothetical protein
MLPLLLSETELFEHFQQLGTPLPFSLSSLQKDRGRKKNLGGVPFKRINGIKYCPDEVAKHVIKQPTYRGGSSIAHRAGRPNKAESQLAKDLGITVPELRTSQDGGAK